MVGMGRRRETQLALQFTHRDALITYPYQRSDHAEADRRAERSEPLRHDLFEVCLAFHILYVTGFLVVSTHIR